MGFRELYRANMEMEYKRMFEESSVEGDAGNLEKARDLRIRARRIVLSLQQEKEDYDLELDEDELQLYAELDQDREDYERERASWKVWESSVWRSARTVKPGRRHTSLFHLKYEGLLMCDPKIITNDLVAYDIEGEGVDDNLTLMDLIERLQQGTHLPFCGNCELKAMTTHQRRKE